MMSDLVPTFVRDGREILAFFEDRVIASGTDFDSVEQSAVDYLDSLGKKRAKDEESAKQASATHVLTPNGLKGEILGRVDGVWGEKDITVRFDNGRIAKLEAHSGDNLQYINEKIAASPSKPIESLQASLDEDYSHDIASLKSRTKDLDKIIQSAADYLSKGASYMDESKLSKIALSAEHEKSEISEAIEALESADAEAIAPPSFEYHAAEQASMGRAATDNWLDNTIQQMIDETEGQDFDKLLAEGPGVFVADLDGGALADAGTTQEMAFSHIVSKTAAFEGDEIEKYREQFLAAVEIARRAELKDRGEVARAKQAKEETTDFPDEALFA